MRNFDHDWEINNTLSIENSDHWYRIDMKDSNTEKMSGICSKCGILNKSLTHMKINQSKFFTSEN